MEQFVNVGGAQQINQLTKLLPAVEPEIANDDDELANECNPERSGSHRTPTQSILLKVPFSRVWKDAFWTNPVRGSGTG